MALAVGAVGADGGVRVGAARVDVTGPLGPSQAGRYDHEKVYVRAIVLDNGAARAALVSVESGQFDWMSTLPSAEEHRARDFGQRSTRRLHPRRRFFRPPDLQVLNTILRPGCAETAIVNTVADLETQYLNA
jgi:hypothetical protein